MKINKRKVDKKILIFVITIILMMFFIRFIIYKNEIISYATTTPGTIKISNAKKIKAEDIIKENTEENIREEIITEEVELEYITQYRNNSELPKGQIQVLQEGRTGLQTITIKNKYIGEEKISEEQVGSIVSKAAVNKIVEIGTSLQKNTHKVQKGDKVYVSSDRVAMMSENDINSTKITTLSRNTEMTVLEIKENWYKISANGKTGWVKIENTTYIDPNPVIDNNSDTNSSIEKCSFNMALNKPSGLSLEQFKKVLNDSKDKNNIFSQNAEYFYYIEKQYNINGIFVAAVGIHESAWGTSKIALNKNNLFGYGAYDSSPSQSAYSFSTYSEGIDLIARVFVKYYLNPSGTTIYDGEKASGKYYNGNTLSAVNQKYATDKNWANSVYKHMEYLYKKI